MCPAANTAPSHDTHDADVLIVGAGPVGLFLAYKLALGGHTSIIVEKQPSFYPRPRAVTFDDEIARIFSSIGIDADHDAGIEITDDWYLLRNNRREVIARYDWRGTTSAGWHRAYWFHQPELEQRLARMLGETGRSQIVRQWTATDLVQDDSGVTLIGSTPGTSGIVERSLRSRYLVGADGANSLVRAAAGLDMEDLGFFFDWLICDILPKEPMTFDPPVWQLCDPDRPTTIVPGGPGRRRWEFMVMPGEDPDELDTAASAWKLLEPWGVTPETADLERHVVWRFQAKWADEWQNGRVFIAGDAAHLMPPFAGQGMCAGIRDATNLAWRLDLVLRGVAAPQLLDGYGSERRGHVSHFVNLSMEIGKAICVTDHTEAAQRDRTMLAAMEDPTLAPPPPPPLALGPGTWRDSGPHAGRLSTQGIVSSAGHTGRFDEIVGRGWILLGYDHDPGDELSAQTRDAFRRVGGRTVAIASTGNGDVNDVDGTYRAWFTELGLDTVLVRPDFYVAMTTTRSETEAALSELVTALNLTPVAMA